MNNSADTSDSGPNTVRLAVSTGLGEAAALKERLLPLLGAADAVVIDLTCVERVDTAALQLLFAFNRDRAANGLNTVWQGSNPGFWDVAATLNLNVGAPTDSTIGCADHHVT